MEPQLLWAACTTAGYFALLFVSLGLALGAAMRSSGSLDPSWPRLTFYLTLMALNGVATWFYIAEFMWDSALQFAPAPDSPGAPPHRSLAELIALGACLLRTNATNSSVESPEVAVAPTVSACGIDVAMTELRTAVNAVDGVRWLRDASWFVDAYEQVARSAGQWVFTSSLLQLAVVLGFFVAVETLRTHRTNGSQAWLRGASVMCYGCVAAISCSTPLALAASSSPAAVGGAFSPSADAAWEAFFTDDGPIGSTRDAVGRLLAQPAVAAMAREAPRASALLFAPPFVGLIGIAVLGYATSAPPLFVFALALIHVAAVLPGFVAEFLPALAALTNGERTAITDAALVAVLARRETHRRRGLVAEAAVAPAPPSQEAAAPAPACAAAPVPDSDAIPVADELPAANSTAASVADERPVDSPGTRALFAATTGPALQRFRDATMRLMWLPAVYVALAAASATWHVQNLLLLAYSITQTAESEATAAAVRAALSGNQTPPIAATMGTAAPVAPVTATSVLNGVVGALSSGFCANACQCAVSLDVTLAAATWAVSLLLFAPPSWMRGVSERLFFGCVLPLVVGPGAAVAAALAVLEWRRVSRRWLIHGLALCGLCFEGPTHSD